MYYKRRKDLTETQTYAIRDTEPGAATAGAGTAKAGNSRFVARGVPGDPAVALVL